MKRFVGRKKANKRNAGKQNNHNEENGDTPREEQKQQQQPQQQPQQSVGKSKPHLSNLWSRARSSSSNLDNNSSSGGGADGQNRSAKPMITPKIIPAPPAPAPTTPAPTTKSKNHSKPDAPADLQENKKKDDDDDVVVTRKKSDDPNAVSLSAATAAAAAVAVARTSDVSDISVTSGSGGGGKGAASSSTTTNTTAEFRIPHPTRNTDIIQSAILEEPPLLCDKVSESMLFEGGQTEDELMDVLHSSSGLDESMQIEFFHERASPVPPLYGKTSKKSLEASGFIQYLSAEQEEEDGGGRGGGPPPPLVAVAAAVDDNHNHIIQTNNSLHRADPPERRIARASPGAFSHKQKIGAVEANQIHALEASNNSTDYDDDDDLSEDSIPERRKSRNSYYVSRTSRAMKSPRYDDDDDDDDDNDDTNNDNSNSKSSGDSPIIRRNARASPGGYTLSRTKVVGAGLHYVNNLDFTENSGSVSGHSHTWKIGKSIKESSVPSSVGHEEHTAATTTIQQLEASLHHPNYAHGGDGGGDGGGEEPSEHSQTMHTWSIKKTSAHGGDIGAKSPKDPPVGDRLTKQINHVESSAEITQQQSQSQQQQQQQQQPPPPPPNKKVKGVDLGCLAKDVENEMMPIKSPVTSKKPILNYRIPGKLHTSTSLKVPKKSEVAKSGASPPQADPPTTIEAAEVTKVPLKPEATSKTTFLKCLAANVEAEMLPVKGEPSPRTVKKKSPIVGGGGTAIPTMKTMTTTTMATKTSMLSSTATYPTAESEKQSAQKEAMSLTKLQNSMTSLGSETTNSEAERVPIKTIVIDSSKKNTSSNAELERISSKDSNDNFSSSNHGVASEPQRVPVKADGGTLPFWKRPPNSSNSEPERVRIKSDGGVGGVGGGVPFWQRPIASNGEPTFSNAALERIPSKDANENFSSGNPGVAAEPERVPLRVDGGALPFWKRPPNSSNSEPERVRIKSDEGGGGGVPFWQRPIASHGEPQRVPINSDSDNRPFWERPRTVTSTADRIHVGTDDVGNVANKKLSTDSAQHERVAVKTGDEVQRHPTGSGESAPVHNNDDMKTDSGSVPFWQRPSSATSNAERPTETDVPFWKRSPDGAGSAGRSTGPDVSLGKGPPDGAGSAERSTRTDVPFWKRPSAGADSGERPTGTDIQFWKRTPDGAETVSIKTGVEGSPYQTDAPTNINKQERIQGKREGGDELFWKRPANGSAESERMPTKSEGQVPFWQRPVDSTVEVKRISIIKNDNNESAPMPGRVPETKAPTQSQHLSMDSSAPQFSKQTPHMSSAPLWGKPAMHKSLVLNDDQPKILAGSPKPKSSMKKFLQDFENELTSSPTIPTKPAKRRVSFHGHDELDDIDMELLSDDDEGDETGSKPPNSNAADDNNPSTGAEQMPLWGRPSDRKKSLESDPPHEAVGPKGQLLKNDAAPIWGNPPNKKSLLGGDVERRPIAVKAGEDGSDVDTNATIGLSGAPKWGKPSQTPLWGIPSKKKPLENDTIGVSSQPQKPPGVPMWGRPSSKDSLEDDIPNQTNVAQSMPTPLWGKPPKRNSLEEEDENENTAMEATKLGQFHKSNSSMMPTEVAGRHAEDEGFEHDRPHTIIGYENTRKEPPDNLNVPLWGRPSKAASLVDCNYDAGAPQPRPFSSERGRVPESSMGADARQTSDVLVDTSVAKLPTHYERESWSSASSGGPLRRRFGGNLKSDDDDSFTQKTSASNVAGTNSMPLFGKKAKKHSSLEDDPDVREIAFAEGSAIVGRSNFGTYPQTGVANNSNGLGSGMNSIAVANGGRSTVPLNDRPRQLHSDRLDITTPSTGPQLESNATVESTNPLNESESSRLEINPAGLSEEEILNAAILASQKEQEQEGNSPMTADEIEDAKGNARTIRSLINNDDIDIAFLKTVISMSQQDQKRIEKAIEAAMINLEDDPASLETLIDLNGNVLEAIESGLSTVKDNEKPKPKKKINLDVEGLVRKKDIFSLICMLRVHERAKRMDAALALMRFARAADQEGGEENRRLRDEIRSSGGLHSLLTLFRNNETLYELKVVSALAVAYVLPSFVESSSQTPPSLGLKIVECLRFLSTSRSVTPNGASIETEEMCRASAMALTAFWVNHLEPLLNSKKSSIASHDVDALHRSVSLGRLRGRTGGGVVFDQRHEAIALDELLEMTVSLIIHITDQQLDPSRKEDYAVSSWTYTLVEQICAVEVARPIAVRDGILHILVSWIRSKNKEKIRPAASALRYLTSINDKYMAGWIHSEMVNKGAVKGLADLTHDISVSHDIRFAIVQILSSLCAAPHTRAAVVEANCINFLIGFLYEHSDPSSKEVAFFAGNAILQLAAGAITRASAFSGDETSVVSPDKRDTLVDDIVASGVIASFVSIALSGEGELRLVAVQALRVISEDTSPYRRTRLQLCEDSAAKALGVTLRDGVSNLGDSINDDVDRMPPEKQNALKELHEALCALANILDPVQEGYSLNNRRAVSTRVEDPGDLLVKGCLETAKSGGLESLLSIASVPFIYPSAEASLLRSNMELVEESCRSLALLSPLLLSPNVIEKGYSKLAPDLLLAFHHVLKQLDCLEKGNQASDRAVDLYVNALHGISALAKSDPLQVWIVDRTLPQLLQAKGVRDQIDVSNAATQAFQSLDFAEDEVAVQVAGNNPNVLADWFCLKRSLLLQAMARSEIRHMVINTWSEPFHETPSDGLTKLVREISSSILNETGDFDLCLFENIVDDFETAKKRESLLYQYKKIYEDRQDYMSYKDDSQGLLKRQMYPLNSSYSETNWILSHEKSLSRFNLLNDSVNSAALPHHVANFLSACFPSRLLLEHIIPIETLQPEASFNFRAFMMPQRRYFSFRREGQLLSSLCDTESVETEDVHWTLGFTNSSFAGEFAESLVQALYLCPMILGLSFAKNSKSHEFRDGDSKETQTDDGGKLLATLAGSLPPWISHMTFDGLFGDAELAIFVDVLETMGKLSAAHDIKTDPYNDPTQKIGQFFFLAICNSPNICEESWISFFNLFGKKGPIQRGPSAKPLSSLKVLDISWNELGDDLCASILEMVYSDSGCRLEELDLSGNCIRNGASVLRVLRVYALQRFSSMKSGNDCLKSSLRKLRMASNDLHYGNVWLDYITLLHDDGLELESLDLSSNELSLREKDEEFLSMFIESLWTNTTLLNLNLSHNCFPEAVLSFIIHRLSDKDFTLTTLNFDNNVPELSKQQVSALKSLSKKARKNNLQKYYYERKQIEPTQRPKPETSLSLPKKEKFLVEQDEMHASERIQNFQSGSNQSVEKVPASQGDNMITVLFSAPLVFNDGSTLRSFAKLDFDMERELMWQCLKEASRDIELSFDSATHDRLLATMAKRCSCLHYSGHGHQQYLPFEDGAGGPYWFKVEQFKNLIVKEGGAPFRFVFVSACYSYLAGATFASAGVPHVVCCQQESELKDTAALAFTRQFYLALSIGHTVKESFEQGCKAVRATPNLKNPDLEMKKFLLLPEDGNHEVPIFNAKPVSEWPKPYNDESTRNSRRMSRSVLRKGMYTGGARSSELSTRNMMQEDPSPSPPQFFLGREVDMYYVLKAVLGKRLVSIVGEAGVGRSSLACALCHYINERASTIIAIQHIYFVKARRSRNNNPLKSLVRRLVDKLADENRHVDTDINDMETTFDEICKVMKHEKALIVFDRAEVVMDVDEANEFPMLLSKLCRETKNVKVLLTNRGPLGIPSLGEHPISLGPLNFSETVRLFAKNCPYLHTPTDRRKLFDSLVIDTEEGELLSTDPGLTEETKLIFAMIGDGIPSKIEKAAYDLTKEDFLKLMARKVE